MAKVRQSGEASSECVPNALLCACGNIASAHRHDHSTDELAQSEHAVALGRLIQGKVREWWAPHVLLLELLQRLVVVGAGRLVAAS